MDVDPDAVPGDVSIDVPGALARGLLERRVTLEESRRPGLAQGGFLILEWATFIGFQEERAAGFAVARRARRLEENRQDYAAGAVLAQNPAHPGVGAELAFLNRD